MSPVKGFVGDVWKMAVACASGAFLLSLVIGLVAGNPFGVVILRAFLLAVLFAGLGAGLRLVVKAYLPELAASSPADEGGRADTAVHGSADVSAERRGASVDITLQDDDGLRRQAYGGSGRPARGRKAEPDAAGDVEAGDEGLAASLGEDFMTQGDTPGLPELAEELEEELPPAPSPEAAGSPAGARSEEAEVEEPDPDEELPRAMRGAPGGVDSLPDLDGLDAPEERPARPPARPLRPAAGDKPADAVRNALSGQDPTTLARAIRTVLKNAEKG